MSRFFKKTNKHQIESKPPACGSINPNVNDMINDAFARSQKPPAVPALGSSASSSASPNIVGPNEQMENDSTPQPPKENDVGRAPPGRQRRNNRMSSIGQDEAYNQVCNFLNDDEVVMVGIYGMAGVGKTTLMRKIERKFLKPSHFEVIWVVVSKTLDIDRIQEFIMGKLKLAFNKHDDPYSRAEEINDALGRNKVAILFDDIWECLDLEKLGILGQENLDTGSFKLIFTTRSKAICEKMQSDKLINVQPLGWDDSWALFKRSVGSQNDIESWDSSIVELAKLVARECKGLPLALKVIGGAMAYRRLLEEWRHALATLRRYPADIPEAEEHLFTRLKFSFDSLSNRRAKGCFLYTCLYPEDRVIEANMLIECWIGEGILTLNDSYQEALDEGINIFRTLQAVCLFETLQDSCLSTRIHDVIRDMGIWITNSHEITDKTESRRYSVWCEWFTLPEEAICSNLTTLIISIEVGKFSLFTSMSKLRVIKLKGVKFEGIPTSIGELTELRHLELIETNLERLPDGIRNLRKLQVMHHNNRSWEMNIDLPEAIGELTELRRLVCSTRKIPTDIGNLKKLEELRIDSPLVEFPQVICQLVNLKKLFLKIQARVELPIELGNLNKLEIFKLDEGDSFHFVELIPNETFRNMHKLSKLSLPIRNFKILPPSFFQELTSLKRLSFTYQGGWTDEDEIVEEDDTVEEAAHMYDKDEIVDEDDIVEEAAHIYDDDVASFLNQSSSLPLRTLKIKRCPIKKFQVPPTSNDLCIPCLEELHISDFDRLDKMEVMSQTALPSIRVLDITGCDSLKHISGLEHLQSLVELKISRCSKLEEVIRVAGDKTLSDHSPGICFPKLEKLTLAFLPQLKSICSDAISFPSLLDFLLVDCPELRVLPRGLVKENKAPERQCYIEGGREWYNKLQWQDEDFKAALDPHFLIKRDDESEHDLPKDFVSYDEGDDQLQLSEEYTPFGEAVFGREQDKEIVKNLLLSAGETEGNYSFVAIAGKEGMGKTTLARIVFNDIIIMRTFNVRSWACVSNSSKFETIVKQLLESATNEKCPQQSSLNELEYQLQLLVHGKQCLLVLDGDGLDRSPALERILSSLKDCGEGTKIVVTVSNEEVAHAINNCVSHCLLPLLDDTCWMRFMAKEKNFGRFYPRKEFQRIAKKIITKCEGVPLAVKLLVGILERQDSQTLDSVISNDIRNFIHIEVGISNAWKTIYGYLPDNLKSCLEYFTLFSNYFVSEDTLLGLWVAEGFVLQSIDYSEMFSSASEVLAELQYRCLINKDISMHNVIRHLVRSACSKFYYQLDKAPYEGAEKITHASLLGRMIEEKDVEWLLRAKGLCTIFPEFRPNEFLDRLVNWKSLRVICLSEADEMELPSSIGDLEQLRYLRIYKCGITSLPNSICSLSNLQSLEVEQCRDIYCLPEKFGNLMNLCRLNLRKTAINCLPSSFYNLSNLRDLNLSETGICSLPDSFYALSRLEKLNIRLCHNLSWLPQQFGSLTQLRCLSDYPVRQRGSWGGISELKDLNKLEGILCISNLGNIGSKKEAESAHLEYKEGLRELIFQWSTQQSTSTLAFEGQTDLDIAQGLRPPGNVRSLSFVNYYADRFPEWMSNKDFFPFLHNLSFSSCSRVKILGLPCGNIARVEIRDCLQLMSLNVEGGERTIVKIDELIIVDCPNLESIGSLCTRRNLHIQGCNKLQISLQTLVTSMVDLESIRQLNIYCDSIFLTFKQLCVIGNPNLSLLPGRLTNFTSLRVVELDDCPLLESIALPPNIIKLRIANCPLLQYLPTTMLMLKSLRSLKIHNFPLLQNLRSDAIPPNLVKLHVTDCLIVGISPQAEFLQVLHIHGCPNLKSITDEELPGSLVELAIHDCQSLESLSNQGVYNLANLQILQLTNCGKLSLLPGALLSLTFLKELRIDYSPILVSGLPSTLEKLKMWGYENLQCFPQQDLLQNLSSLQRLKIVEFPQLEPLVKELPSSLKQLSICDCPALTILNIDVVRLNSLKKLKIMNCHFLELFGENGLPSMLVELKIMNCEKLKYLPKNLITLTCLESISIFSCPELELQPENRLPKNLSMLKVIDCPRLILEGKEGACSTWSMKHIPFRYFA